MKYGDITVEFIKEMYLFGINLEDMYGNKMSDELLQHHIKAALSETERKFHILLKPTEIENEVHDYYSGDYSNWGFMQLAKRPVIAVHSLDMVFADVRVFNIPKDWIRFDELSAQVQLLPMAGSGGGMVLTAQGSYLPYTMGLTSYTPQIWRTSYKAGFSDIPEDLVQYICKKASISILQIWGDLIIGAGISNQTISLDGLSQSIGTTQSPEFSGAGARIKAYKEDIKELETLLQDYYLGMNIVVI